MVEDTACLYGSYGTKGSTFTGSIDIVPNRKNISGIDGVEVFAHLQQLAVELEQMLASSRNILFIALLLPAAQPVPANWWYYGVEHGQHVAINISRSLRVLAKKFHLNFSFDGVNLHLWTKRRCSQRAFRLLSNQ